MKVFVKSLLDDEIGKKSIYGLAASSSSVHGLYLSAEYVDRVCMNWKTLVDADEKTRKVEYYGVITPRDEPQLRLQSLLDLPSDHPLLTTFYKFGTAMCGSRKKVKCREGD